MVTQFASPLPALTCEAVHQQQNTLFVALTSTDTTASCPLCGQPSQRVHSRYKRRLTDLPILGQACQWQLEVCKFFCDNHQCGRRIFTQRFADHIQPYARWVNRAQHQLRQVGLAAGGQLGSRMGHLFGLRVSGSTLLRRVRQAPLPAVDTLRIVGIDDWAFKKGKTYGTILVDMEKHQVIDLLPDRETETVKKWLEQHPSIEIISRDRASSYAQAATQGAPQAVQVADRWHLLKNLGDTLQRVLETQRSAMKEAAQTVAQTLVPLPAQKVDKTPEPPPADSVVTVHQQVYEQVKAHQSAGKSISWVATHLRLSRHTVRKYWSWDTYQPKAGRRWSPVCRYEEHLQRRLQQGHCSMETLYREVQEQGYQGSVRTVYRAISRYKSGNGGKIAMPALTDYSPRQVSFWLSRLPDELPSQAVQDYMRALFVASPLLKRVGEVALTFKELMAKKQVDKLDGWLVGCEELGVDVLNQFIRGLRQDYAAVRQAFCSDWSNGQVEGQVNRLKTVKRQMYGRADLDLLRLRMVIRVG